MNHAYIQCLLTVLSAEGICTRIQILDVPPFLEENWMLPIIQSQNNCYRVICQVH